jgi:hypothetical protein
MFERERERERERAAFRVLSPINVAMRIPEPGAPRA